MRGKGQCYCHTAATCCLWLHLGNPLTSNSLAHKHITMGIVPIFSISPVTQTFNSSLPLHLSNSGDSRAAVTDEGVDKYTYGIINLYVFSLFLSKKKVKIISYQPLLY